MKKPRIFISYSSNDRIIVEKLHQLFLKIDNLDVWHDQKRLETDWSREIAFALADSDVLCLMWSENSTASKWVKHEWLTARALEKRIVPILFPNAPKLPKPLRNLRSIHLEENDLNAACQEVANRLRESESFIEPYDFKALPTNSYIPFNPNPKFTGRHVDLLELYLKMISNFNKTGINQVGAVGMGGVGKTQLAVEFAYRFSFAFDRVFWIQAADVEQWRSNLVQLARDHLQLSISDPDEPLSDKRYIVSLQKYFKNNPQTLVIMDNVLEPKLLNDDKYLYGFPPLSLGCHLLFTTRQHFSLRDVTSHVVNVLSPESAYMLLTQNRKPTTPEEDEHARGICGSVGYLPLAIILAAGYLNEYTDVSFSEYQTELIKNKLDVIDIGAVSEEELATRHVAAVYVTLEQEWGKIKEEAPAGVLILRLCSYFAPDDIPRTLISEACKYLPGELSARLDGIDEINKDINLLNLYSWTNSQPESLSVHQLVQEFVRDGLKTEEQNMWAEVAVKSVNSVFPAAGYKDRKLWPTFSSLVPHAKTVIKHAAEKKIALITIAELIDKISSFLDARDSLSNYKEFVKTSLKPNEKMIYGLKIFLCHASEDKHYVRELYDKLLNDGFTPWLDEKDIVPGRNWSLEIEKAVRNSDIILAILSRDSINKRGYVQKEIKTALDVADELPEESIFLIPVKIQECKIPNRLSHLQWVSLFNENGYDRLVAALKSRSKDKYG